MALIRSKPTSPGRRFRIKVNNSELHKGKPCESLIAKLSKTGGIKAGSQQGILAVGTREAIVQ